MCVNIVLQMYIMIACLRMKSDLGEEGGITPNLLRDTRGVGNRNVRVVIEGPMTVFFKALRGRLLLRAVNHYKF